MPPRGRLAAARVVLLRSAPVCAALAAGVGVVWLVRPGVVTNGVRSPVVWLVVVSAVVAVKLLGMLVRRVTGRRAAGTAASVAAGLLASYVLLAPSFTQRTLEEPFPDLEPLAAPKLTSPPPEPAPKLAARTPAAPTPPPAQGAPARPPVAAPAPSSAAPPAGRAPAPAPDRPVAAPVPPPPAPSRPGPRSTPAPAAATSARQISTAQVEGVGHSASGRTAFYEVDGEQVLRFEDVDIEGTPGPVVHLVRRGARSPGGGVRVGELKAEKGTFSYQLPASVDLRQDWTVLVWCEPYDTPIAAADH